jgi:hypothetical protein
MAMRALSALLLVLAATVAVSACSGPGPAVHGQPRPAPVTSPHAVGCDQIIAQVSAPGGKVVLGVLAVPPARVEAGAPTGTLPWAYFSKWGIAIRAGSPAVLITVPEAWRHRAAIGWGNSASGVNSLRLLSCPRQMGAWNVYAGGFFLRSASGCVPLVVEIGRQAATLSFTIGSANCASAMAGRSGAGQIAAVRGGSQRIYWPGPAAAMSSRMRAGGKCCS